MSDQLRWLGIGLLAVFFALQPFVAYLSSYQRGDCDDKAVHFFSAMFFAASPSERAAFLERIEPFAAAHLGDPRWVRTQFRLDRIGTYPLPNVLIAALAGRGDRYYTDSVRRGLIVASAIAIVLVICLGTATPLGLWGTLVVLNLLAFRAAPIDLLVPPVPTNIHPFTTYAPRGTAALFVIPAVAGLAGQRWWVVVASIAVMVAWHTALGALATALIAGGALWIALEARWRIFRHPAALLLFAPALLSDLTTTVTTIAAGASLFAWQRVEPPADDVARHRVVTLALVLLLGANLGVAILRLVPGLPAMLGAMAGSDMERLVPERLAGLRVCLPAVLLVAAAPILWASSSLPPLGSRAKVAACVLAAIVASHLSVYLPLARRKNGLFDEPTCRAVVVRDIPAGLAALSLDDEAGLFASFGNDIAARAARE